MHSPPGAGRPPAAVSAKIGSAVSGSVRYISRKLHLPRSTVGRWIKSHRKHGSLAVAAAAPPPSRPPPMNKLVTPALEALLRETVLARSAAAISTDIRDITEFAQFFMRLLKARNEGGFSSAPTASESSGGSGSDDDGWDGKQPQQQPQPSGGAAMSSAAGLHTPAQMEERRGKSAPDDVPELARSTLRRIMRRQKLSLHKAQARKRKQLRPTLEAEAEATRHAINANWPLSRVWCMDETFLSHVNPPSHTYGPIGEDCGYVQGEQRGAATTLLFNYRT